MTSKVGSITSAPSLKEFRQKVFSSFFLGASEAADTLGVSLKVLRHLRKKGTGPSCHRVGQNFYYYLPDIQWWLKVAEISGGASGSQACDQSNALEPMAVSSPWLH